MFFQLEKIIETIEAVVLLMSFGRGNSIVLICYKRTALNAINLTVLKDVVLLKYEWFALTRNIFFCRKTSTSLHIMATCLEANCI